MRHIREIMEELGFNKEAPIDTQKAFLKNVMKAAAIATSTVQEQEKCKKYEQLSFSLDNLNVCETELKNKNVG